MSALKRINIGFGGSTYTMLQAEAALDGVPLSRWVVESAIWRASYRQGERGDGVINAMRKAWAAMHRDDPNGDLELNIVIQAVTKQAPGELNAMLRKIEQADPDVAVLLRGYYGLKAGEYLPEETTR